VHEFGSGGFVVARHGIVVGRCDWRNGYGRRRFSTTRSCRFLDWTGRRRCTRFYSQCPVGDVAERLAMSGFRVHWFRSFGNSTGYYKHRCCRRRRRVGQCRACCSRALQSRAFRRRRSERQRRIARRVGDFGRMRGCHFIEISRRLVAERRRKIQHEIPSRVARYAPNMERERS